MDGGSIECCMSMLVAEKFLFTAGIKASTIARVACAGAGKGGMAVMHFLSADPYYSDNHSNRVDVSCEIGQFDCCCTQY